VLAELVDKHNHIWDAVRYALELVIRRSGMGLFEFYRHSTRPFRGSSSGWLQNPSDSPSCSSSAPPIAYLDGADDYTAQNEQRDR
jgi:hypothetical protein